MSAESVTIRFDMPEAEASFRVDPKGRTIQGVLVPWDKVAYSGGRPWLFRAGSLHATRPGAVKLNVNHDPERLVGRATRLQDTPRGLAATFKVARGDDGDRVLSLAEDGVLDGLSAEVDFARSDRVEPNDAGVNEVFRGSLTGAAVTGRPAFDDARLETVMGDVNGGPAQPGPVTPEGPEPQAPDEPGQPEPEAGPEPVRAHRGVPYTPGPDPRFVDPPHPLAVHPAAVVALQAAMDDHAPARFVANDPHATFTTLTTATIGQPQAWGSNVLAPPRMLHMVAGVPTSRIAAVLAEFPQLTLPTAQAASGEAASLVEYDSSAAGQVTLGRLGRFTDRSAEGMVGTDAAALLAMHRTGIALDLDDVLISAVETAAGTAVAFNADVPAAIRSAIARVLANTAQEDPGQLVILANPDDTHLLEDVQPVGGATIGERFQRFSGALVFPSNSVSTGFMTVANLRAGARYFTASALQSATFTDVKTGVETVATFIIAGYGVTLTSGFAVKQDVVTP